MNNIAAKFNGGSPLHLNNTVATAFIYSKQDWTVGPMMYFSKRVFRSGKGDQSLVKLTAAVIAEPQVGRSI
jgi:hypothetical protein